jgi:hypothetical protein
MSAPLEEDILPQPILGFYLFVAHGNTISANHNYYPIKTEFRAITFYSKPYESYIDTLGKLLHLLTFQTLIIKNLFTPLKI